MNMLCAMLQEKFLGVAQHCPASLLQRFRRCTTCRFFGVVDPITGWRFYQKSLQKKSSLSSHWVKTHGKTSNWRILSILQALTIDEIFSELGQVSVAWRNLQPTDGVCKQYTHKYSTYRVAQHDHANTRGSRAGRLRIAHLSVHKTIVIHVSCLILCRT